MIHMLGLIWYLRSMSESYSDELGLEDFLSHWKEEIAERNSRPTGRLRSSKLSAKH